MTIKEYAHEKANELIQKPTKGTIIKVVNDIIGCQVNGRPITFSQINEILSYIEIEVGDLQVFCEAFDNTETLSLMGQVRELISQVQASKNKGE
ncbi:hypothetical protein D7V86_06020 [bacterium D16-51]|nr:hypothetical protein D7V96_06655 [bacterium D16-59]RKI61335.1 hypothetical protein D7V86_06020 [bacterium D16-51]